MQKQTDDNTDIAAEVVILAMLIVLIMLIIVLSNPVLDLFFGPNG